MGLMDKFKNLFTDEDPICSIPELKVATVKIEKVS